jgi:NAD(P)-dependent dehydrogenase (short-subunit alcohol dehydrogenase family)
MILPDAAAGGRVMPQEDKLRTFEGAVVIITGGASGIGRALGMALARRGAHVTLADLQGDLAEQVAASIRSDGGTATAAQIDVTDFNAVHGLAEATVASCGRLDYMFNNAGIGIGGEVRLYQLEDWQRVFDVNLRGVTNGIQAAYPVMLRQGYGHMVNTASMAGLIPAPGTVAYCASKHAVVGLSTSLRVEATALGVRVSVLCPGVVRTAILEAGGKYGKLLEPVPRELQQRMWERLRPMHPDHFADRVLRHVARNRAIIIVPAWWKIFWWLNRLSPSLGLYMARKSHESWRKTYQAEKSRA